MSKVLFLMSVSLDGFMRAPHPTATEPLGAGGEQLHNWALGTDPEGQSLLERMVERIGAVVCGRGMYDDSLPFWGKDGPTGRRRLPTFVVTHRPPPSSPDDGVYRFVTDGIRAAIAAATAVAGEKHISIGGGADLAQQAIRLGLIDELTIATVPVLFGGGLRLFDNLGDDYIQLQPLEVRATRSATLVTYRVTR